MSNYGITGWSGGPRQSLTHNLRAGQFRGMGRTNIFPSTTVVNNNFFGNGYGIYDDCCCNNNNSTPSWMNWMMGIGLGTSLLGNILGMFGIGGGGGGVSDTEGGGGSETPKETKEVKVSNEKQDEFAGLGTGSIGKSTPPPDETPTVKGAKTSKATSKKSNSAKADAVKPETKEAETFKASYTVSMPSGNKCTLKIDQNGKYHYFDKSGKEIPETEFQKQTGKTGKAIMDKINNQQRAKSPDRTAYTAKLEIAAGKNPTATFKDKNGKVHTFTGKTSGISFSAGTRQKAQIENLKQQIKEAGFTNVNLV